MNQPQNVDLQRTEHFVGLVDGKQTLSFQYIVKMRLGNSGNAGESPLGGGSTPYSLSEFVEQALLKFMKCHRWAEGYFSEK